MYNADEFVLVVPKTELFKQYPLVQGLHPVDFSKYESVIVKSGQFMSRSRVEQDKAYKQIIPYLIFTYNNLFFLMQRRETAGEQRLKSKMTLGIGGHIRKEDMEGKDLVSWARREFSEEVKYTGALSFQPLGLINDEESLVGQVHTGFVFLIRGTSAEIEVRDELASGRLVTLDECVQCYEYFEPWSKMVVDCLSNQSYML